MLRTLLSSFPLNLRCVFDLPWATPGCSEIRRLSLPAPQSRPGHITFSKNGRDCTNRFPGIPDALLSLPCRSAITRW